MSSARRTGRDEHVGHNARRRGRRRRVALATRSRPEDVGLPPRPLRGRRRRHAGRQRRRSTRRIFAGEPGPQRDLAVLNAGAAIYVAGPRRHARGGRARRRGGDRLGRRRGGARRAGRADRKSWRPSHERARAHRRRRRATRSSAAASACRSPRLEAALDRAARGPARSARRSPRPGISRDRRAQAPLAVGGRDPRGRHGRRDRAGLRARRRGGAVDPHRAVRTSAARSTTCAAARRGHRAAGAAQGLHRRPVPALRVGGGRRRRDPADRRRARPRRPLRAAAARRARSTSTCSSRSTTSDELERRARRRRRRARHQQPRPRPTSPSTSSAPTSCSPTSRRARPSSPSRASRTREQLDELERVGVDAVLIGETLMRAARRRGRLPRAHRRPTQRLRAERFTPRVHARSAQRSAHGMAARAKLAIPLAAAVIGGGVTAGVLLGTGAVGAARRPRSSQQAPLASARRPRQPRAGAADRARRSTSAPRPASSTSARARCSRRSRRSTSSARTQANVVDRLRLRARRQGPTSSPTRTSSAAATDVRVTFSDHRTVPARVIGKDADTDLALLARRPRRASTCTRSRSATPAPSQVGDPTVAIGNPFGLERTLTTGVVSALQRRITAPSGFAIEDVIQTDARDQPRQLRRPAARRHRPRDRRQLADRHRRRGPGGSVGHRLRGPGRHRRSACCPSSSRPAA